MSVTEQATTLLKTIPDNVTLLVASKYASDEQIYEAYNAGIRCFGENKIQDAERKITTLDLPEAAWHFIGHLQTNKVNKAIGLFDCIQSIDSLKLLKKISDSCEREKTTQSVYLQVNIANDQNKFGFSKKELEELLPTLFGIQNVDITGIMTIVPYSDSEDELRGYFKEAASLFRQIQSKYPSVQTLSMGMSNDYRLAIEEGSTLVRIGRQIFKG
jgi:pyridoxal phosphate enzyme (YggS family)